MAAGASTEDVDEMLAARWRSFVGFSGLGFGV